MVLIFELFHLKQHLYLFQEKEKKPQRLLFPIKYFLVYIVVPFKLLLHILITLKTLGDFRIIERKIKIPISIEKEKLSSLVS